MLPLAGQKDEIARLGDSVSDLPSSCARSMIQPRRSSCTLAMLNLPAMNKSDPRSTPAQAMIASLSTFLRSARLSRSRPGWGSRPSTFSPRHSSSTAAGGMPVTASMRAAATRRAGQSSSLLVLVSPRTRLANEGGARCRSLATHRNDCTCPAACPSPPSKDAVCTERPKNAGQRINILCSGCPTCGVPGCGVSCCRSLSVAGSSVEIYMVEERQLRTGGMREGEKESA